MKHTNELMDDPELLELMLADQEKQLSIYKPGPYWINNQIRYCREIRRTGITSFRSNPRISKAYGGDTIFWPELMYKHDHRPISRLKGNLKLGFTKLPIFKKIISDYRQKVDLYYKRMQSYQAAFYLNTLDISNLPPNTCNGNATDILKLPNNKHISNEYLKYYLRINNFSKIINFEKITSAIEIGGGYGAWPHIINHLYPNIKKFYYIDIPPMIYIASQYLKQFFNVKDYRETRDLKNISFSNDSSPEVICLCPWQIEQLTSEVDILWNTASFSEMTPEIVDNYAEKTKKLNLKSVCLILNKNGENDMTTSRDTVLNAFGGDFFKLDETINSFVETPFHSPYYAKVNKDLLKIKLDQKENAEENMYIT